MCGVCGIFDLARSEPVPGPVLDDMTDALTHRGPDGRGVYIDRFLGFGHRRLSIIGLDTGQQPMANETGAIWITFNGEIYNYRELRRTLEGKGHVFATDSDTEVIVHLYEEHGADCVSHLNGIFAFALWDRETETLLFARDRLGIKPLYHGLFGDTLLFGSEIKSILRHPKARKVVDENAISDYLLCTALLDGRTMFRNIRSLPPGEVLLVRNGTLTQRRYWSMETHGRSHERLDLKDAVAAVGDLLDSSVLMQAVSDVPLGTMLSGGLDSSLVSAIATRHVPGPLKTFAMGYGESTTIRSADSDAPHARAVARSYGTDHQEFQFGPAEYAEALDRTTWHVEKPIDLTAPTLYLLYREVKPHVKVVMSGEGADELFGGYHFFLERDSERTFGEFPWAPYLGEVSSLLDPDLARATQGVERVRATLEDERAAFPSDSPLNRTLYLFLKYYMLEMLERLDKTSMAWGVESRVPFLDHRIVEFVLRLPPEHKVHDGIGKRLLKELARPLLPHQVVDRTKRPVPIPVDPKSVLSEVRKAAGLVQSPRSHIARYFDRDKVAAFFSRRGPYAKTDNLALFRTAHALIALESWHQCHEVAS